VRCTHGQTGFKAVGQVIQDSGFRIQDSGFRIQDSGFRIQDSGFRIQDSGFRIQDSQNAALTPNDKKIGEIIQRHVGRANAIRGRDLAVKIWPEEMAYPAKYESAVRRWLEESIYRLRRFGHLPIAASKSNPMGYYIPSTAEECDEVHDRLFREGIERIRDSQLFRPDRDLVERLRGQLQLQDSGARSQDSGSAELSANSAARPEAR